MHIAVKPSITVVRNAVQEKHQRSKLMNSGSDPAAIKNLGSVLCFSPCTSTVSTVGMTGELNKLGAR